MSAIVTGIDLCCDVPKVLSILSLIFTFISGVIALSVFIDFQNWFEKWYYLLISIIPGLSVSYGWSFYLGWVGTVFALVATILELVISCSKSRVQRSVDTEIPYVRSI